ncbi:GNAT family N-acetyltransferase [Salinarimonas rosea]|uniref:GNAT family N-acetyltransferase n=1 Tax=Salinarimonas rosea TaxID=552063 RepID=UPI000407E134|nr:GNAT family N-acetyltransferase [Salinarimonas rosea]
MSIDITPRHPEGALDLAPHMVRARALRAEAFLRLRPGFLRDRGPREDGVLRLAESADVPSIAAVQAEAFRRGCARFYDPDTLETLVASGALLDPALIRDGRYAVMVCGDRVVAGAGWSEAGPSEAEDAAPGDAWLRCVFADPELAGYGFGRRAVEAVEKRAARAGRTRMRLVATLNAIPFYRSLSYRFLAGRTLTAGARSLPVVLGEKQIAL